MATDSVPLGVTYTLVTNSTSFVAQNKHHYPQEWVRVDSAPLESLEGIEIAPRQGMDSGSGSGDLYARGAGNVVVIT